ncbi:MAG: glycosyltransferase family 4 protein [Dehalococcoidales bacterium]|nr:glycosyltransferase family 4 protein [Dehalococcoidales bacterium]
MNIILVSGGWVRIPPQEGGGAEAFILNLAGQCSSMRHNVTIIDRKYTADDAEVEYIDGLKIVRLESPRFKKFNFTVNFVLSQICFGLSVNKYLKKNTDIDVVHLYITILGLVLAFLNRSIREKLFYTSVGLRRDKKLPGITDRIALWLENQLIKRVNKTTIANEVMAEKLVGQAKVAANMVCVVPIGVDTKQYNPKHNTKEIRRKYNPGNDNIVLFVGRICADKGVEYLIKAADIVVNRYGKGNVRFLIVGPSEQFDTHNDTFGNYTEKAKRHVDDYALRGKVTFTGIVSIDDKIKLYAACDMVVIPSVVDLDPQVQIEAMASGKPVIGTNVGTMPRRIKDGQSGFIVDPANEKQLADKINYLLDNPDERDIMGANARQIVVENYSAEKMAVRMLEVFKGTA